MSSPIESLLGQLAGNGKFLSFRDYQDLVLYHPENGYYMQTRSPFGRAGDFYTAPGIHEIFGETLAKYIYNCWLGFWPAAGQREGESAQELAIVEYGAGDGRLAASILSSFASFCPDLYRRVRYFIAELSPRSRLEQQKRLAMHPQVNWISDLPELDRAFVLSNEFVDALPVHLLQRTGETEWLEVGVTWEDNRLAEVLQPACDPGLLEYINRYGRHLPFNHRMEANLAALAWIKEISRKIAHGFLLTIDYGAEIEELYPEYLSTGTIRGYFQHQVQSDLYQRPGEMDVTHDVNFTALMETGKLYGMETAVFASQAQFLAGSGLLDELAAESSTDRRRLSAIKHLLIGFPPKFHVLVQQW